MVDADEFKARIRGMVEQEYTLEFLGEHFEETVSLFSERLADSIYAWLQKVIERKVQPIIVGSDKKYRDWRMHELLTFRHAFSIGNVQYRILFVKVKNSFYIEFHLGDHKYYDKVRKELDLKRSSY
jgi:hypothetical protein